MKIHEIETPSYVIDEKKLRENLEILHSVEERTGAKILLAQKCFSGFYEYPLISKYISGTTASGLYEARLGWEEMGKENHVFSPAYREKDMEEIAEICDHVIFNSKSQLKKYLPVLQAANTRAEAEGYNLFPENAWSDAEVWGNPEMRSDTEVAEKGPLQTDTEVAEKGPLQMNTEVNPGDKVRKRPHKVSAGIRINPECSTQGNHAIYDPCAPGSRMGVRACDFDGEILSMIEGIHFHTLCEQNADDLETTLQAVEEKFGPYLHQVKWLNMGGGHHITREDYDVEKLCALITHMKETYNLEIYLEPGEAVALNAGYLVTTVLDIVENDIKTLILDASAACHMPDVLEMPYQPPLMDARKVDEFLEDMKARIKKLVSTEDSSSDEAEDDTDSEIKYYRYRLSSNTCLAGDVIGDYVFDHEVKVGDRLYFRDMAIYSMVKNNTFNGIPLPSIAAMDENGDVRIVKEFGYEDFKGRLS